MWALSHFYGGADDLNPLTCFTANASLCMIFEYLKFCGNAHRHKKSSNHTA